MPRTISNRRRAANERQVWILECILENKERGKMRNTLTSIHSLLHDKIPRSSLHTSLKTLVNKNVLVEEPDEIFSVNNQPMKIIRYAVNPSYVEMARKLVSDYYVDHVHGESPGVTGDGTA